MKLKEIKPGTVIHCKTEEEAETLINIVGWENGYSGDYKYSNYGIYTCLLINKDGIYGYGDYQYVILRYKEITEFSDLIIPEEEMSAEEVLKTITRIHFEQDGRCGSCPLFVNGKWDLCNIDQFLYQNKKIIEICRQWKADHEKKEPEVEWVWQAIDGNSHLKMGIFKTEDEAIKYCEGMIEVRGIGNEFKYEKICRVKGGANE